MKKLTTLILTGLISVGLLLSSGCITEYYNLRTIHDVSRNYISADSVNTGMRWNDPTWRSRYLKFWSSAGIIITNEYNLFKENKWLEHTINGGFEGLVVLQWTPEKIYDWSDEAEGSFRKQIDAVNAAYEPGIYVDDLDGIAPSEFLDGSFVLNPSVITANSTYRNSIGQIVKAHLDSLDSQFDTNNKVSFAIMLPNYPYRKYGPIGDVATSFSNFDPFGLGKSILSYSTSDYSTYVDEYYDDLVDGFSRNEIVVLVGDHERLVNETPSTSLLANRKISGIMYKFITPETIDSYLAYTTSLRTAFTAKDSTESLIFIAGIKDDIYQNTPTEYGVMMKKIVDAGMFFTPGANDAYFEAPRYGAADWWFRYNKDSNWQANENNPVYTSLTSSPRFVLEAPDIKSLILQQPVYFTMSYDDIDSNGYWEYDDISTSDLFVAPIWTYNCLQVLSGVSSQYEKSYIGLVDSLRKRNPDMVVIAYTSVAGIPLGTGSYNANTTTRKVYDVFQNNDGWAKDTSGTVISFTNGNPEGNPVRIFGIDSTLTRQMIDLYVDAQVNGQAGMSSEFTGMFTDWLDTIYPSWPYQDDVSIVTILDFDQDGIPHSSDRDEQIAYKNRCIYLLQYLRERLDETRQKGIIVANGGIRENPIARQYIDGTFIEKFNYYGPANKRTQAGWEHEFAWSEPGMFPNSNVSPPLVLWDPYTTVDGTSSSDSSLVYSTEPIILSAGGWIHVESPYWRYGSHTITGPPMHTDMPELDRRLPYPGVIVDGPNFIEGGSGYGIDTLVTEFTNYTVKSLLGTQLSGIVVVADKPWGYLVVTQNGDTLSRGGYANNPSGAGYPAFIHPNPTINSITMGASNKIVEGGGSPIFISGFDFGDTTKGSPQVWLSNDSEFAEKQVIYHDFTWASTGTAILIDASAITFDFQHLDTVFTKVIRGDTQAAEIYSGNYWYVNTDATFTGFSPNILEEGTAFEITGIGFMDSSASSQVFFGKYVAGILTEVASADVTYWRDNKIQGSLVINGLWADNDTIEVSVTNSDGVINYYGYGVGDAAIIFNVAGAEPPVAQFSGTPRSGTIPFEVAFTDLSSNTPTSWKWYFGDGDSSTLQNPTHEYITDGIFDVELIATNADGSDTLTVSEYIVANPPTSTVPLISSISPEDTVYSHMSVVTIEGSNFGTKSPAAPYVWDDLENGTNGNLVGTGTHGKYETTSSRYSMTDKYSGDYGAYSISDGSVKQFGLDIPMLTTPFDNGFMSFKFKITSNYTDLSPHLLGIAKINSYDGRTSSGSPDVSVMKYNGVTLTQARVNESETNYIALQNFTPTENAWHNLSLYGKLSDFNVANGFAGYAYDGTHYELSDIATYATGANYSHYRNFYLFGRFDFGGYGGTLFLDDVYADTTFARVEACDDNVYANTTIREPLIPITWSSGTITASLNYGAFENGDTVYIFVTDENNVTSEAGYQVILHDFPTAKFTADVTSGNGPLTVTFTDQSTNTPTGWYWTFGDSWDSFSQNPTHTYTASGTYTVTLNAFNQYGSSIETKVGYITVAYPPSTDFSGTPKIGQVPFSVTFTDLSTNTPTAWLWTFGDGGVSNVKNPTHQYTTAGVYDVSLTSSNADGTDVETKIGYIVASPSALTPPVANFGADVVEGYPPLTVVFSDSSTTAGPAIISWAWNFGDGDTALSQNPTHIYDTVGTYDVTLIATNLDGSDTLTIADMIYVREQLDIASPTYDENGTGSGVRLLFDVLATDPTTISAKWKKFYNGTWSDLVSTESAVDTVSFVFDTETAYSASDTYHISVEATDFVGDTDVIVMLPDTTPPDTIGTFVSVAFDTSGATVLASPTVNGLENVQATFEWKLNGGDSYTASGTGWTPATATSSDITDQFDTGVDTGTLAQVYVRYKLRDTNLNESGYSEHIRPFTRMTPSVGDTILYIFERNGGAEATGYSVTPNGARFTFVPHAGASFDVPEVRYGRGTGASDYGMLVCNYPDSNFTALTQLTIVGNTNSLPLVSGSNLRHALLRFVGVADSLNGTTILDGELCITNFNVIGVDAGSRIVASGINHANMDDWVNVQTTLNYKDKSTLTAWSPALTTFTNWTDFTAGLADTTLVSGSSLTEILWIDANLALASWASGDPYGGFFIQIVDASGSDTWYPYNIGITSNVERRPFLWALVIK